MMTIKLLLMVCVTRCYHVCSVICNIMTVQWLLCVLLISYSFNGFPCILNDFPACSMSNITKIGRAGSPACCAGRLNVNKQMNEIAIRIYIYI